MPPRRIPGATYRVQFTPEFGFEKARRIVPYLHQLGITDLYASPILMARPGSLHGYDVIDSSRLNPELGTPEEFEALSDELQARGMGLLLDIVPNHMAATTENPWWRDVLENGPGSAYAQFFDIEWETGGPTGGLEDRVLLPILGSPYGEVLENGELQLERHSGSFVLKYYETALPLSTSTYKPILEFRLAELKEALGSIHPAVAEYLLIIQEIESVPPPAASDSGSIAERGRISTEIKERLQALCEIAPEVADHIDATITEINGIPSQPDSFDLLDQIISRQSYRLAYWRLARERINYRRFFDINELVSMRVDDESVFRQTHQLILALVERGRVTGLRIDHVDGLNDPAGYLNTLQSAITAGNVDDQEPFFVTVEKILAHEEVLPPGWATDGTTGYDFLNLAGGLFVHQENFNELDRIYRDFTSIEIDFPDLAYRKKRMVMRDLFPGVMHSIAITLDQIAEGDRHGRDITLEELQQALEETTACLSVYRSYIRDDAVSDQDRRYIGDAVENARRRNPDLAHALEFLLRVLTLQYPKDLDDSQRDIWLKFVMRWQQYSGPIMAKGYEDTALYIFNRLLSLNEVGGHPQMPGTTVEEFHERNRQMLEMWPHTMNATSTHDTKRSEDVRSRIALLSTIPAEWRSRLEAWAAMNADHRVAIGNSFAPDRNEEILIYQTLVGAWPADEREIPAFEQRMTNYLIKAAREAKVHTSWIEQNEDYEEALSRFIEALFDASRSRHFIEDVRSFVKEIALSGAVISLSLSILKATAPGIPDYYQGTELWDLSLVDPDNRRPVDYDLRRTHLEALTNSGTDGKPDLAGLARTWTDGRLKLFVTHKVLTQRRQTPRLFSEGAYVQLLVDGERSDQLVAFARKLADDYVVVVVPRTIEPPLPRVMGELAAGRWENTWVSLPPDFPADWVDIFTERSIDTHRIEGQSTRLRVSDLFGEIPAVLLSGRISEKTMGSGQN